MAKYKDQLINREISWLQFNERVLQEASDETTPLLERLKFLGIFSNNRDEFFRVRVATLTRMINVEKLDYSIKYSPGKVLAQVKDIVAEQEKVFNETYEEIVLKLAGHNIFIIREDQLNEEQAEFVTAYFHSHVRALLFPIMLDNLDDPTSLEDKSIYLAVHLQSSTSPGKEEFSIIKVPTPPLSRFFILPEQDGKIYIMLLDDVIRHGLPNVFSLFGYDTYNAYTIKITRDAELDIDNDVQKSFLEIMTESIKQREWGTPVRFVFDRSIPPHFLKYIREKLLLSPDDRQRGGGRYHNFKDFMSFPKVGSSQLVYPESPPLQHKDIKPNQSIFEVIRHKDIMLHYPYHSFQYIIDWLREASIDPNVRSIKMTFYRAASESNVMNALMNAARNGKSVTVFLELQARFDEEANIYWAEALQKLGVKILSTIPGMKVHSKLISIRRKENKKDVYYANVSTGNFNESTARVYSDESLLTANQDIATDVDKIFQMLETRYHIPKFKALIVSPFKTRDFFISKLNREMRNAKAGKEAWAIIKLNSIVDKKIARKLYDASKAGVKITIIARAISIIASGIKGVSDNIEISSIVDKFLEHSRIFVFCNEGNKEFFTGSSDWMQRNFDHRVEATTPIFDKEIQEELWTVLQIQMHDNCKARLLSENKINTYRKNNETRKIRAQFEIYDFYKNK